jgi:hypothetical protein
MSEKSRLYWLKCFVVLLSPPSERQDHHHLHGLGHTCSVPSILTTSVLCFVSVSGCMLESTCIPFDACGFYNFSIYIKDVQLFSNFSISYLVLPCVACYTQEFHFCCVSKWTTPVPFKSLLPYPSDRTIFKPLELKQHLSNRKSIYMYILVCACSVAVVVSDQAAVRLLCRIPRRVL